jgi:hypothetical protein
MFRRRIGVVVVVVGERSHKKPFSHKLLLLKTTLERMLKKTSFHTRKKFRFSMITRVRSWLAYPEDAPFPIRFLFYEIVQGVGKRAYTDLKE